MILIFLISLILSPNLIAAGEKKIIIKYKQYERFDLGSMEVKGNIIAPGDISVQERKRKIFDSQLINKTNFDKEIINDIKFIQ
jgi:hypothetical protein